MLTTIHGVQFSIIELVAVPGLLVLVGLRLGVSATMHVGVRDKDTLNVFVFFVILFLVSIFLSWFEAIDKGMVLRSALKWLEIFVLAGIVFLYSSTERRLKQAWWFLALVYLVSVLLAYANVFPRLSGFDYAMARTLPGYSSLFLFCLLLPFARRPLIFLAVASLSATVVASLTRGAWIGLAGVFGYWLLKLPRRRAIIAGGLVIAVLSIGILFAPASVKRALSYKLSESLSGGSASNEERLGMAATSLGAFVTHPFTGIGGGNFSAYMLRNGVPDYVHSSNPQTLAPHEFFLQVAAEQGIVGLIAILGVLAVLYRILFSVNKGVADPYVRALRFYFIVVIVALLFGYVSGATRFTLGLFMGLVLSTLRSGVANGLRQRKGAA